jgi:hypothetical protein
MQKGVDFWRETALASSPAVRARQPERGPQKKKGAVRVNERPKSREETPKEGYDKRAGLVMPQCKSYVCAAPFSNAIFAELHVSK